VYLDIRWATPLAIILGIMAFLSGIGLGVLIHF